jgi:large subunit ribosomal protein L22
MNITAKLNNYRQSPRKVRLVSDLICGKSVLDALDILSLTVKRASDPILNLLKSAIANAKENFNIEAKDLTIKNISVDCGAILYRRMPRARGIAYPIRKRVSCISLVLSIKEGQATKAIKKPVNKSLSNKKK